MKKILLIAIIVLATGLVYAQVSRDVTITVTAGIAGDVVDAYAFVYGYQAQLPDPVNSGEWIPNPESKNNFALRMFGEEAQENIRRNYIAYMTSQGADAAAAQANIDSLGITVQ